MLGRLVAAYGEPAGDLIAFPEPAILADADPQRLQRQVGLTSARTKTLLAAAALWADGFTLRAISLQDVRAKLLAVPGIGPWTVDYLMVRALQDPDTFAPGDLVARRAMRARNSVEAAHMAAAWSPYRSYALVHSWASLAYSLPPVPRLVVPVG